ncbi:MAG: class I SAM-dependent rRNA methyltransferase [Candidatus Gracilibacteria bacterium]
MINLTVKKERVGPVLGRHPWIFSGALSKIPDGISSGTPVHLIDDKGNFLAQGYFSSYSQIAVRVWSYDKNEEVNDQFFIDRISKAYDLRKTFVESKKTNAYRLVNSENDFLPGLIVDKYADYLVVQFHTAGIENWKDSIVKALEKIMKPKGIYERSDVKVREIEKLEKKTGLLSGEVPETVTILENGFKFLVDVISGQKTGFFLDQRDKRAALTKYVEGKNVLNCFSYTGGFSVYALAAGAKKVVSVDVSASALELAKQNMELNKLDLGKCEFVCEDVKRYLAAVKPGEFDVIILDPPAFIKDRRKIEEGLVGYRKINEMGLRALESNGILVSCSCSSHLKMTDFRYVLSMAGRSANKTMRIVETYTHGMDHPEIVAFTEGEYLKVVFGIID